MLPQESLEVDNCVLYARLKILLNIQYQLVVVYYVNIFSVGAICRQLIAFPV